MKRGKLEDRVKDLRNEYESSKVSMTIQITKVGNNTVGIHARLVSDNDQEVIDVLDRLYKDLYNDGYNVSTIWEDERKHETDKFTGKLNAALMEEGKPETPEITSSGDTMKNEGFH